MFIISLNRGAWTPEEDIILLEKTLNMGKKWATISRELPGRNENSVKNRFITLSKGIKSKGKRKSDKLLKDPFIRKEFMEMIKVLRAQLDHSSLNKNMENLEINSPFTVSKNYEKETEQINNLIWDPPVVKTLDEEKEADCNKMLKNDEVQQNNSKMMNNYSNYLFFLHFLNSQVASPVKNLEQQYLEIKNELRGVNQKDMNLSNLHFSSSNDRRASATESKTDSKFPGSKRPSNSFTSLYLTPSIISSENEEITAKNFKGCEQDTSATAYTDNSLPQKLLNKNKKFMGLIIDEIKENNQNNESSAGFAKSISNVLPTPILTLSNMSVSPSNPINQDFFRFSPLTDHSKEHKKLSPIMSMNRIEQEYSPLDRFIKGYL